MGRFRAFLDYMKDPLSATIAKLRRDKDNSEATLNATVKRLAKLQRKMQQDAERAEALASQARKEAEVALALNKKYEAAINAAEEKIDILEKVVVPGLSSANATFQETWTAESAAQVLRQQGQVRPPEEL